MRAAKVVAGPAIRLNDAVADAAKILVVVSGPPRTKKNHGVISTKGGRPRLFASPQWVQWCRKADLLVNGNLLVGNPDVGVFLGNGPKLHRPWIPVERLLNCAATFYRDGYWGDAVGFYQGLADLLESRGVILNDRQLVSWDGSRLLKDTVNPRTEIVLTEAV